MRDGQNVAVVHRALRDAILTGAIPAGGTMTQAGLAREFGVSRTPLREAVRLLQNEGLVAAEPNRRIRVAPFSAADAEELYALRIAIEAIAVQVTVPKLQPEDFAELEGLMAQMDHYIRAGDVDRMGVPHRAFHLRLVGPPGSRFESIAGLLFDHSERYRRPWFDSAADRLDTYPERRGQHRAILDAAAAGDLAAAAERLAVHYAQTATMVVDRLEPGRELALLRSTIASVAPGVVDEVFGQ
jgi:DNA-binding GntR family transcriptional regulator